MNEIALTKEINLNARIIEESVLLNLLERLQEDADTKTLKLDHNQLSNTLIFEAIGHLLGLNTPLEKLTLSGNTLGDEGLDKILEGLESNENLKVLHLNKIGVSSFGIQKLAGFLSEHHFIEEITLTYNNLGKDAIECLAQMLRFNQTLKILKLDFNQFGDNGLERLLEVLPESGLTQLGLRFVGLSKTGLENLAEMIEDRKISIHIDVRDNPGARESLIIERINNALIENQQQHFECQTMKLD